MTGLLAHLRLHYQLLLAPVFLWGYFLSGARATWSREASPAGISPAGLESGAVAAHADLAVAAAAPPADLAGAAAADFWIAFVAFHVFLYGGATAFNSYYDRDTGPIGGLRAPPPISQALLPFSLAMQAVGVLLAALVDPTFLAIYLAMLAMGIAYSHPRIRLKARPLVGLTTVALGQGVLACLGGWAAGRPDLDTVDPVGWIGILAATLVTVGFYPITQAYQVEDDRARGDITFAVWAGPRRALGFSIGAQALGAALLAVAIADRLDPLRAGLVVGFYAAVLTLIVLRARAFGRLGVIEQYRRVMALNAVMSGGFLVFVVAHLFVVQ